MSEATLMYAVSELEHLIPSSNHQQMEQAYSAIRCIYIACYNSNNRRPMSKFARRIIPIIRYFANPV